MLISVRYQISIHWGELYERITPRIIILSANTLKTCTVGSQNPLLINMRDPTIIIQRESKRPIKWLNLHADPTYWLCDPVYVRKFVRAGHYYPSIRCRLWILPLRQCRRFVYRNIIFHRIIIEYS